VEFRRKNVRNGGYFIRAVLPVGLFGIIFLTGCTHFPLPNLPEDWSQRQAALAAIPDDSGAATLQIIIAYGEISCHHAALRLVASKDQVLFWDPGGGYENPGSSNARARDLILTDPPDLKTYLKFRWLNEDKAVEIFEWHLRNEDARELYGILMHGTDENHPAGAFKTITPGLFCSYAISDFLNRFAAHLMKVPRRYFLPHDLSKVLYTQSPDRVLVFHRGNGVISYSPK